MGRKTTVSSHSRKGTKGINAHTRELADAFDKLVPHEVEDGYDKIISLTEFRIKEAKKLAIDESNLEHRWMDLEVKRLKLQKEGMKIPSKLTKDQNRVFERMNHYRKRRLKHIKLIREKTKVLPPVKRRQLIRKTFNHRGLTKRIS